MTVQRAGGYIVLALMVAGALGWVIFTVSTGRRGAGSEVELAANRKQYLSDEELETTKLDRSLLAAVGLFFLISLALPFYWLAEGGRQAGAVKAQHEKFVRAGETLYTTGAQCVACHGPAGHRRRGDRWSSTTKRVGSSTGCTWNAPALNTVLWRFSEDEVRYILNYGRPGSPMQPWGVAGGGPYNSQQIDQIIDYLWSIQLPEEKMRTEVDDAVKAVDEDLYDKMVAVREENDEKAKQLTEESGQEKTVLDIPGNDLARLDQQSELWLGEILFSLKAPGAGAYNCSRCHIPGAAYGKGNAPFNDENPPAKGPCRQRRHHRHGSEPGGDRGRLHGAAALQLGDAGHTGRQAVLLPSYRLGQDARVRCEPERRAYRRAPTRPGRRVHPGAGVGGRRL
jgi:mono/diheme cytochrome c family protein